jgi:hypothetical protein
VIKKVKNITDRTIIISSLRKPHNSPMHIMGHLIHGGITDDLGAVYSQIQLAKAQPEIVKCIARGWLEEAE